MTVFLKAAARLWLSGAGVVVGVGVVEEEEEFPPESGGGARIAKTRGTIMP